MKLRTRLRFHNLPMPNAAGDLAGEQGGGAGGGGGGGGAAWYGELPATNDDEKGFKTYVEGKGFKTPLDALKSYRELEGKVGNALTPWKEGEDPTQWPGWSKLGRPEKPEGYQVKRPTLPEGMTYNEAEEKAYLEHAHKIGTPQHIVQQNIDFLSSQRAAEFTKLKELETQETQALDKLYGEWNVPKGADGKWQTANHPQLVNAQRAYKAFGMDGEIAADVENFIGGARMMKLFAAIGAHPSIKEGGLVTGEVSANTSKESAMARIKELDDKYRKTELTKEEKAERSRLFAIAYPSQAQA